MLQFSEGLTSTTIFLGFDKSRSFCSSGRKSLSKLPIDAELALKKKKKLKESIWQLKPFCSGNQGLPHSSVETRLGGFVSFLGFHPLPHSRFLRFIPFAHRCLLSVFLPRFPFLKALVSRFLTTQVSFEWYSCLGKPMKGSENNKDQNKKTNQHIPLWGPLPSTFS